MTAGSAGIYLLLDHHIQTDEPVVGGYDLLKLQNAELQLLADLLPKNQVQDAVSNSRASEMFVAGPVGTGTVSCRWLVALSSDDAPRLVASVVAD